ncbi:hypothetical protein [Gordonia sp. NB41Y]|uniref:hypothetical protein n=1 Tax=Gordonia sp. NB41Y TaxID=875808 RepID=UPI0006B18FAF|nr:hypothetical protein [Gordonia sp. NB41Y]WLP91307.1 hypothetical protein Q9K23_03285 [Gordonia sp. NB41Y]
MVNAVDDWYDAPTANPGDGVASSDFYDPPQSRLDLSRFPSKNGGLPIDVDLINVLAGDSGFASKPDAEGIALSVAADLRGFVNALLSSLQTGDPAPVLTWITTAAGTWIGDFTDWGLGIGANFAELVAAVNGTYTGTDEPLLAIQTVLGKLRGGLTGLIDMARIPQLSLSQLTSQPGPNLLTGFGDFADAESMDGGGVWVWDGTVGGGSARATGDGTRKVLTSELVAVAEGQVLAVAGKVQWSGAAGSGPCLRLVVMPFVGDTALPEVVISSITSPPASSSGFVTLSGNHTVAANVTGVRVRLAVEAALTAGTVWWDDVTLRKTATSLPQQWISGLTTALGDLGDGVAEALAWIKDLIEKLTGQARTSIEDAVADALAFGDQLKTILGGGTVGSPLPNLAGAAIGTIQTVLNQIADILRGLVVTPINTAVSQVADWFNGLTGWRTTTTSDISTVSAEVVDLREQLQAVSVTQQWVSLSTNDIASFPRVLLGLGVSDTSGSTSLGSHDHGFSTTSQNGSLKTVSGTNPVNVVGFTQTENLGSHTHTVGNAMPTLTPGKGTIGFVPLVVDRYCRPRYLKLITGTTGWSLFSIDYWYVGLYKYNPNDGLIYKIYDGGDQKSAITSAARLHAFDMGTGLANLTPGEILFAAQLQNANALTSTRPIAGLWQPGLVDPSAELLAAPFYQLAGQSSLPTSVALSALSANNAALPWMGVGTIPAAA